MIIIMKSSLHCSTCTVLLTVNDINDNSPEFLSPNKNMTTNRVNEDLSNGSPVLLLKVFKNAILL